MKLFGHSDSPDKTLSSDPEPIRFGMITGVYVPTLLTVLGVVMYLRLGWVVGSVGLAGTWLIIAIAYTITTTTTLSMASIISNIRIGPGGAFSMITQSLGIEIGGSIGVPFYLSMVFSVILYIFGFREGLLIIFPSLPGLLVDLIIFGAVFAIVFFSTDFAFRLQYLIVAILIGSLISIVSSGMSSVPSFDFSSVSPDTSFWIVFAVFFPAATGIMAGANMSGELENPRKSIPIGTLATIGTSLLVYLGLSYWLAGAASPEMLVGNYTIMFDLALIRGVALAGLLAASFSSAINSLIGASRILHAMADHNIMPYSSWFAFRGQNNIPRNAILFTAIIAFGALMLRDFNTLAPLITMFFLITYAMINIVILVEQKLNLVSFRPILRIPIVIPFIGTIGTLFTMFIINPAFSLVAIVLVVALYYILMSRHLIRSKSEGDMRSSLFVSFAEWAAKKSMTLPRSHGRAWRPNILIPVDYPEDVRGVYEFLHDITFPSGSVNILGIGKREDEEWLDRRSAPLVEDFRKEGIYCSWTAVRSASLRDGVLISIQAMKSAFFGPNTLFLRRPANQSQQDEISAVLADELSHQMGIILY
ncbi:MAG: amino acid permease, partial [Methanobacteriota archaeon]